MASSRSAPNGNGFVQRCPPSSLGRVFGRAFACASACARCPLGRVPPLPAEPPCRRLRPAIAPFVLNAKDGCQLMPVFRSAEGRSIYHRRYVMALDVAENVALFEGLAPRTCIVARDPRAAAMEIPVFFVVAATSRLRSFGRIQKARRSRRPIRSMSAGASRTSASTYGKPGRASAKSAPSLPAVRPDFSSAKALAPGFGTLAASLVNTVFTPKLPAEPYPARREASAKRRIAEQTLEPGASVVVHRHTG